MREDWERIQLHRFLRKILERRLGESMVNVGRADKDGSVKEITDEGGGKDG